MQMRTKLGVCLVILVAVLVGGSIAWATIPDANGVIHACYNTSSGKLSVMDASIMPDVPSGFTHLPTIMLAERLSEQIASLL